MFSSSESSWSTTRYFRNDLHAHKTIGLRPELIQIHNCIWWSTDCDKGERGMVQYDPFTDTITCIVKYTRDIQPSYHSCCKYQNNIYIVDGRNGQIICFKPHEKLFIMKLKIAKIGRRARCIVLHDEIHILNGFRNCKHLVYSIKRNSVETFCDPTTTSNITEPCFIKYHNKIIRFGGFDMKLKQFTDTLFISSDINNNNTNCNDIQWCRGWKLIRGVAGCGYVIYKEYIIIFGGRWALKEYTDAICVLNFRQNTGWQQLKHIKCPMASQYVAVLKDDNTVHLLTAYNKNKVTKHYSIAISSILVENIDNNVNNNNDDEKYDEQSQTNIHETDVIHTQQNIPKYQAKESEQQQKINKLQKEKQINLQPIKRKKKKQKKRLEILESIAEFEAEMSMNEEDKDEISKNQVEMEAITTLIAPQAKEIKVIETEHELKATENDMNEDEAKEEEEEIEIEYILLKQWHLAQYIPMLVDQMGYDDIEDWKDLILNDLREMKFKPGHAARFIRMTKQYFESRDN